MNIAIKEKSILLRAPEIQLLLDGHLAWTRRTMRPQPTPNGVWNTSINDFVCACDFYPPSAWIWKGGMLGGDVGEESLCPVGQAGDVLWVRETFAVNLCGCERGKLPASRPEDVNSPAEIIYRADGEMRDQFEMIEDDCGLPWRAPAQMPRWASRLNVVIDKISVNHPNENGLWEWVVTLNRLS